MFSGRSSACAFPRACFLLLFSFIFSFAVQAQTGGGSIGGTVTDASGALIPGAQVSLLNGDGATQRTTVSHSDGTFDLLELPSGNFRLLVSAPGFAPYRNESVSVAVGRTSHLSVQLAPAGTAEQVKVQAESNAIDTSQSSPVTNIDRDRIEELPIPSRNYLNFTLLSPSLTPANPTLAPQNPGASEAGFSAGGLRPSSNALSIDGSDDNDEFTGLSRTELSPEAINDFQIVNHGYAAQSGGAAGGAVDVETRAGASTQHGDAFLFIQNGALNATPALERVPHKPDESRMRAGLSTGGEFKPAHFYYYVAAEQEAAHGEEASDFSPQLAGQVDSSMRVAGPLRGFAVQQGFFPTTNEETELSGRVDSSFGANGLMLRYALTNNRSVNDAFNTDDLSDVSQRGSAFVDDHGVNGTWTHTFSPQIIHQLHFQLAQRRVDLRSAFRDGPGIVIAGIAQLGTPFFGNGRRYETHGDVADHLLWQTGKHLFATGFSMNHIALRTSTRDGFEGLYVFPDLASFRNAEPDFFVQSFGNPDTNFAETRLAAYAQDRWTPKHNLTFDYGLRYEANLLPHSIAAGLLNFSPRLGFAWTPTNHWVLRGGYGLFFDRYLLSTINRIEQFNGGRGQQQVLEGESAAALYRANSPVISPSADVAPSIWQAAPRLGNPYAETTSIGVERALPSQWTVNAEYRLVRGVHMGRTVNVNLPAPVALTTSNASTLGVSSPSPQELGRLVFPDARLNPSYDAINQFQTEASSTYHGFTATVNRQFTEEFELMAGYTYSRSTDDASFDTEQPQNPYDLRQERARSLNDQAHRFVLSGLWVLGPDLDDPQDQAGGGAQNGFQKFLNGFEFAPIASIGSGFPDDPLTGVDSNREHIYPFEARPLGAARNSLQTPATVNIDLRVLKMVPIWRGHLDIVGESFNLLNRQNGMRVNPVFGSDLGPSAGFNRPIQTADSRRVQFSLDFEY